MKTRLQSLLARRTDALNKAKALTASLGEGQDLTAEQRTEQDTLLAQIKQLNRDVDAEKALEQEVMHLPADADFSGGAPAILKDPKRGFKSFGDYATSLIKAGMPGSARVIDQRLLIGADVPGSSFGNEAVGADGGFTVPPQFATTIKEHSLEGDALLPFTSNDMVQGNSIKIPVDETTPWGTAGVHAYWEGEAAVATKTKPVFELRELSLKKLFGLVPVSDELLADSGFMATYLPRKLGISIRYKTNDAIVNGTGAGRPQGFRISGAIVEQAKVTSQVADTIVAGNIAAMYARCLDPTSAIWLINPDAFPQIPLMTIGDQPIWTPPQEGFKNAPNGLLLGRPLLMSETCQTVGDAGDIYFAALNHYQTITKSQGIDFATSLHLWFDYDMAAFRAVFRIDGQSLVRQAVTPPNSAVTRSPWVRLAARA
jgi:HK97 family phage major capsid protein